jgi:hypothetical protein
MGSILVVSQMLVVSQKGLTFTKAKLSRAISRSSTKKRRPAARPEIGVFSGHIPAQAMLCINQHIANI